nr:hypothetical protein CFP56_64751 [Quercus suber]
MCFQREEEEHRNELPQGFRTKGWGQRQDRSSLFTLQHVNVAGCLLLQGGGVQQMRFLLLVNIKKVLPLLMAAMLALKAKKSFGRVQQASVHPSLHHIQSKKITKRL